MAKPQSFANHARIVPAFHFFVLPVLVANLIAAIVSVVRFVSFDHALGVLVALALLLAALFARMFALTVQDRVIRLEMRLRLRELLAPELHARIAELTPAQLVALRFASDAELPALTAHVLTNRVENRKAIKQMIKTWEADHLRA